MKSKLTSLAAALLLATGAQSALAQEKLNIGYPPSLEMLPALVAHDKGCLKNAGIESSLTPIPIATNIPPALLSGSIQIGMSTPTILLPAVENGLDLLVVAGNSMIAKGSESVGLLTQPSLGIQSAAQLAGRKVGVPGIMSVADVVFRKWLKDKGVDPSKVTFIEVPFPRMADMMKAGTVDAVVAAEPVLTALVKAGLAERKAGEYYSEAAPNAVITLWSATGEWVKAHPNVVKAFKACLDQSVAWIKSNPAGAGEVSQKYLNFNSGFTPTWRPAITTADLEFFVGVARDFKLLRKNVEVGKLIVAN